MAVLFAMSLFYMGYGILGLFGKMNVPEKFQNQQWTKDYVKEMGIANILLGTPWLILCFVFEQYDPGLIIMFILIIVLALPAFSLIVHIERKYNKMLK